MMSWDREALERASEVLRSLNGAEHDMSGDHVFDLVVGVAEGGVDPEKPAEIIGAHLLPAGT